MDNKETTSYAYSTFVKNILLELPGYQYNHGPIEGGGDEIFLGRKKITEQLLSILKENPKKSGVYLVTGYRGMGKTSFVNRVISEYSIHLKEHPQPKKKRGKREIAVKKKVVKIDISLAQKELTGIDILRQITKCVLETVDAEHKDKIFTKILLWLTIGFIVFGGFGLLFWIYYS
ncbi:MAG: hypothetical protein H6558_08190 [Lewinellaceae bacterium]|nr:hypothetical protein [Lewinellaceae bacterium]